MMTVVPFTNIFENMFKKNLDRGLTSCLTERCKHNNDLMKGKFEFEKCFHPVINKQGGRIGRASYKIKHRILFKQKTYTTILSLNPLLF